MMQLLLLHTRLSQKMESDKENKPVTLGAVVDNVISKIPDSAYLTAQIRVLQVLEDLRTELS